MFAAPPVVWKLMKGPIGGILDMGSLKPGTECEDGQIVASN